ncbi:hypothetical protein [Pseudactinotalea sp. Z1732]|uniref:hypothetical protein n=1 Tax=Micrococcales TaxID=85006 RepID=UPI003C7EAEEE
MAKMVPAWDKRTGQPLPNKVPKKWLDNNVFPNLTGTQQGATNATRTGGKADTKEARS